MGETRAGTPASLSTGRSTQSATTSAPATAFAAPPPLARSATWPPSRRGASWRTPIQEAAVARLVTQRELRHALEQARGRPGARLLQTVLATETAGGFTRSHAERRLIELLDGTGLPRPEVNVRIEGHLVDAVWQSQRLIVEIDGFTTHGTAVAFAADRARDAELQAAGWRVLRFTYAQLRDEPLRVLRRLIRALDALTIQDQS